MLSFKSEPRSSDYSNKRKASKDRRKENIGQLKDLDLYDFERTVFAENIDEKVTTNKIYESSTGQRRKNPFFRHAKKTSKLTKCTKSRKGGEKLTLELNQKAHLFKDFDELFDDENNEKSGDLVTYLKVDCQRKLPPCIKNSTFTLQNHNSLKVSALQHQPQNSQLEFRERSKIKSKSFVSFGNYYENILERKFKGMNGRKIIRNG